MTPVVRYPTVEDGEPRELEHSLLPLRLAAELVWARVYDGRSQGALLRDDVLNSIATTLAVTTDIYEYSADPAKMVRRLSRAEIEGGSFRQGARELYFFDGRPLRRHLAVRAEDVQATIDTLNEEWDRPREG